MVMISGEAARAALFAKLNETSKTEVAKKKDEKNVENDSGDGVIKQIIKECKAGSAGSDICYCYGQPAVTQTGGTQVSNPGQAQVQVPTTTTPNAPVVPQAAVQPSGGKVTVEVSSGLDKADIKKIVNDKVNGGDEFRVVEDSLGNTLADYATEGFVDKANENGWSEARIVAELKAKQERFEEIGENGYAKWDASEIQDMVESEVEGDGLYTEKDSLGNTLADYATQDFVDKANSNQWDDGQILFELQAKQVRFEGVDDGLGQDAFASFEDFDEFES